MGVNNVGNPRNMVIPLEELSLVDFNRAAIALGQQLAAEQLQIQETPPPYKIGECIAGVIPVSASLQPAPLLDGGALVHQQPLSRRTVKCCSIQ